MEIRLTEDEYNLILKKGANYPNRTCLVMDAIRQMGDHSAKEKLTALHEMTTLYKEYQQSLSWMGGNFNQVVKRANELAIGQELTVPFFEHVLFPQIEKLQELLVNIKEEQHAIAVRLTKPV